jgi:hypothetical protein
MKKFNLTVGCLLLFALGSTFAIADEDKQADGTGLKPRIGVEGGFNLASLNGPNVNDVFASRLGFVVGAFIHLPMTTTLAIQPELLYSQKGGKYNGFPYQLDYMEVPILLDISFIGPLSILLGPSIAANVQYQGLGSVNQTDIGLVAGAQLFLTNVLFSGRYEVGLTDVNSNQQIQNGTFTFMVGLSII